MYTQIFLVTSVRGMVLPPQIFANASLSFFGAKMPFAAVIFFSSAFVMVVFVVVVVTVIAIVGGKCKH